MFYQLSAILFALNVVDCLNVSSVDQNDTLNTVRVIFNLAEVTKPAVIPRVVENFSATTDVSISKVGKKPWSDVKKCLLLIGNDCRNKCEEEVPGVINATVRNCFEKIYKLHHKSYLSCTKSQEAILNDSTPCWDSASKGELFHERELDILTQLPWLLQSVSCWRNCMSSDRDRCYKGCTASADSTVALVSRDCQRQIRRKDISSFKDCLA